MEHNIRRTDIVNATYRFEQAEPKISANVRLANGLNVESIENGVYGDNAATFSSWGENNLSVNYNTAEGRTGIHTGIEAFINEIRNNIEAIVEA